MNSRGRLAVLLGVVLLGGIGGWALVRMAAPDSKEENAASRETARPAYPPDTPLRPTKTGERSATSGLQTDAEAEDAGALRNQRTIRFSDRDALERFLKAIEGRGISVLGSLDRLNTLRVGFLSLDELLSLLEGDEELGLIFPVNIPRPAAGGVQDGAVGFGRGLLEWLGITGDNSSWGSGVRIAILDTGVAEHPLLGKVLNRFLVDAPASESDWNGHGTAVASLIKQIAPGAQFESWMVADTSGYSNSFLLAQAILEAIDAGVNIINVSMGGTGNSPVLSDAVRLATEAGILIIAPTGNDGYDRISYPAAYEGVVAVGAVDARGEHLLFSNSGEVSFAAPGLDLLAAWTGGQSIYFSGTSGSAPVGSGIVAALMSMGNYRSPFDAYSGMLPYLNDSGAPGFDSHSGAGIPNIGRILRGGIPGYVDGAITANYVTWDSKGNATLQVTVQNQGTEPLVNTFLQVNTPAGLMQSNITTLRPGQISTFTTPLPAGTGNSTIQSSIQLSGGAADMNPANNQRTDAYTPPAAN